MSKALGKPNGEEERGLCANCGSIATQKCANCKSTFYCKRECQKEDWGNGHKDECRPVKIESNSVLGRYVVATKAFKPGDIIFKEKPLVVGPKQMTVPLCLSCYSQVDGEYRCSMCNWPLCGPSCENGTEHYPECVVGREIGSPIDIKDFNDTNHFYEVVMPLRCLSLKKTSPNKYNELLDLESHYKERKGSEDSKEDKHKIVNMLRNYFMLVEFPHEQIDCSEYAIERSIGILNTNAIDIPWKENDISGLYSLFSMVEHSCIPNVKCTFSNKKHIILKATMDIQPGDHLSISNSHILCGTVDRREHLKLNKFFMCTCRRCADPTELGSNLSTIKCQECKPGYLTSAAPLDELANWICSDCNSMMAIENVKEFTATLGEEVEDILSMPTIEGLETFFKEKLSLVHPNHFHLFVLKHTLLQLYGRDQVLDESTIKKKEKLCQECLKICTVLDPGMSRLTSYASVALYEYHLCMMSRSRQSDGGLPDTKSMKKDIKVAKSLLRQCIHLLADGPQHLSEGRLREVAMNNLMELESINIGG